MNNLFFLIAFIMVLVAVVIMVKPLITYGSSGKDGARTIALFTLALMVFGAVSLYAVVGTPLLTAEPRPAMAASAFLASQDKNSTKVGSVSTLLTGLESRLEQNPLDGKGWLLLAKSYKHLGRAEDARDAYEKAAALGVTDPDFDASLESDSGDTASVALRGRISVADGIANGIDPDSVVFVIATGTDGNPMPIAVLRRPAAELPFDYVLDDSASMMAGRSLSDTESVYVTAKVSRSGDALDTSAGIGARVGPVSPKDGQSLDLVIDTLSAN